jgi:hypothetical protein
VIAQEYSGMSKKAEGRSQEIARIVGDRVTVYSSKNITFDRNPTEVCDEVLQTLSVVR